MLTRAEHTELVELLFQERYARAHYGEGPTLRRLVDNMNNFIAKIGPSPFEHPMLAKQQNDGLREKQGR